MINELLNDSSRRRLQKITERLNSNRIKLNLPSNVSKLKKMRAKVISIREQMALDQKFNSYHNNEKYNNLNLILEAINCQIKRSENETKFK